MKRWKAPTAIAQWRKNVRREMEASRDREHEPLFRVTYNEKLCEIKHDAGVG